jgi:integrase
VERPSPPEAERLFLTDSQAKAVIAAGRGLPQHALTVVALGSGCRMGELLGLSWDAVDLARGTLSVRRSLSWAKGKPVLKEPKSKAGIRTVTLPPFAAPRLREHRAELAAGGRLGSLVFPNRDGGYFHRANVLRSFRRIVARANALIAGGTLGDVKPVPAGLRFHDCRHTHASLLLSNRHSLKPVSQRLGHANPTITLKVYSHCMPTDDATLAAGVEQILG